MGKKKPSTEELADEAKRVTAIGLFNFAETYWRAARALRRSKAKSATHRESPIRFLFYHAIELYLKAHLRSCDVHPYELRSSFGHGAKRLAERAVQLGLFLEDEDVEIVRLMSETDAVIRSRYIASGFFTWPELGALDRTCKSLRVSVAEVLRAKGQWLRLPRV